MTSLQELTRLVPPPERPVEAGPATLLGAVEAALGLSVPKELVQFAQTYGSGAFGAPGSSGLVEIHNPFSPRYVERVNEIAFAVRSLRDAEGDEYIPFPIFPEKAGLLPFGYGEGERLLFWLASGPPDAWPILVSPADRTFLRFDLPLSEFLRKLFSGEIDCWGAGKDAGWFKAHMSGIAFSPDA